MFPALPLFCSLLCPRSHVTRSCRSLSRVAVSCWRCSWLVMLVLVLLGSICSLPDARHRFYCPRRGCLGALLWERERNFREGSGARPRSGVPSPRSFTSLVGRSQLQQWDARLTTRNPGTTIAYGGEFEQPLRARFGPVLPAFGRRQAAADTTQRSGATGSDSSAHLRTLPTNNTSAVRTTVRATIQGATGPASRSTAHTPY